MQEESNEASSYAKVDSALKLSGFREIAPMDEVKSKKVEGLIILQNKGKHGLRMAQNA